MEAKQSTCWHPGSVAGRISAVPKVATIQKWFAVASDTERTFLEKRLNEYDEVWARLALSAVRCTGAKIKGTKDWSPVFAHKGAVCQYWNQHLRHYFVSGELDAPRLVTPAKYVPSEVKCEEDIHFNHGIALKEWHLAKGNTANL